MSTLAHTARANQLRIGDRITGHTSPNANHPIPFGRPHTIISLDPAEKSVRLVAIDEDGKTQKINVPNNHLFFLA